MCCAEGLLASVGKEGESSRRGNQRGEVSRLCRAAVFTQGKKGSIGAEG